jgi:hypothetical protein
VLVLQHGVYPSLLGFFGGKDGEKLKEINASFLLPAYADLCDINWNTFCREPFRLTGSGWFIAAWIYSA